LIIAILAGGSGTRFWPASRETLPKQFLPINGSEPLIYETYRRIAPLVGDENIFLVINRKHRGLVDRVFQQHRVRILEEPEGKNTASCIGLVSLWVEREFGDQPLAVLPSDHYIAHEERFRKAIQQGLSFAREGGMILLGAVPTYPESGYGYIEKGEIVSSSAEIPIYEVRRFVEKPDVDQAQSLFLNGNFFWNMGVFIFKPKTMLSEIKIHLPGLYEGLSKIREALGSDRYETILEEVYASLLPISIDYGVMEKTTKRIYFIPGEYGWSDVGSWQSLFRLKEEEKDSDGNLVKGNAILLDTRNSLVYSNHGRFIGVLGLENALVVDTEDVLLISNLQRSQELRRFPEILEKRGWKQWI
jgi:mannose-1-phosphate guanylyltransferase